VQFSDQWHIGETLGGIILPDGETIPNSKLPMYKREIVRRQLFSAMP